MPSGRLGSKLLNPYSSCVIYCNTSSYPASISINAQVIDKSVNSDITVGITTCNLTLTGTAIVAASAGAGFSSVLGPVFERGCILCGACSYCGSFVTSQQCGFYENYIAGSATTVSYDACFIAETAASCCRKQIYTQTITNPALRLGKCAYVGVSSSNILGLVPHPAGCDVFMYTEFDIPNTNAAGMVISNPCAGCCGSSLTCISRCKITNSTSGTASYAFAIAYDWYALCCYDNNATNAYPVLVLNDAGGCCNHLCTYCFNRSSSGYSALCNVCGFQIVNPTTGSCCTLFKTACTSWGCATSTCGSYFFNVCATYSFNRGVLFGLSKGIMTVTAGWGSCRQSFFPYDSGNILCGGSAQWCGCTVGNCGAGVFNICSSKEFPVKWFEYNPVTCCHYFLWDDITACGIYSINCDNFRSFTAKDKPAGCNPLCEGFITSMTNYFTRVKSVPTAFSNSCLDCIKNLYRVSESIWAISVLKCGSSCFESFITTDLVNWSKTNEGLCFFYGDSDFSRSISLTTPYCCITINCNCFFGSYNCDGLVDYKVTSNNYERNGIVISSGDRVVVNNTSPCIMSAQVWGYEG